MARTLALLQKTTPLAKILLLAALLAPQLVAAQQAPPVKIVGIGATTCGEFAREATTNPSTQRQYLAWMQGYMSGIMIGRPPGSDEGIDLTPKSFPLQRQLTFIREYCTASPTHPFADAVETLYKRLRAANAT
jgi:hypothetical protein